MRMVAITSSNVDLSADFGWQKADMMAARFPLAGLVDEVGNTKPKVDREGQEAGSYQTHE